MHRTHRRAARLRSAALVTFTAAIALVPCLAHADDTIKHPGDHPQYAVEIEPHVLFGWDDLFPGSSFGLGARFSIPIVDRGFVPTINDTVAITFGADLLHFDGCYYAGASCSANFLILPVAMQWNFYVAHNWSVFGEPGLFIYHGFFDECPAGIPCLATPRETGVSPALYVGGRYHFNDHVALTMRLGFPTVSVGVSFL
jgi:hypothetical protein